MPEKPPYTETEPSELMVIASKFDVLIQTLEKTNALLMDAQTKSFSQYVSFNETQNTNAEKITAMLNKERINSSLIRGEIINLSAWLGQIHNRLQESNTLSVQLLEKDLKVTIPSADTTNVFLKKIVDLLLLRMDEGSYENKTGTASTTVTVYDFLKLSPYHPVKGYVIKNDGTTTLSIAVNDSSKFYDIRAKEGDIITNDTPTITKIFIRTDSGTTAYRLRVLW